MNHHCSLCRTELDPTSRFVYRRVAAWEKKSAAPGRRGGSDLLFREPTGEIACSPCIEKLRSGLAPSQEALL